MSLGGGSRIWANGVGSSGAGVRVFGGGSLQIEGGTVIGNHGPGVVLDRGSNALFYGASVTANEAEGIRIENLSVAGF